MARDSSRPNVMTGVATQAHPVHEIVLDAIAAGTPLRIAGRSHWIDAGRPVNATRIASLATHTGVVDYVPGDLTITVRSGTTLREIDDITRANHQWLPLDPFGSPDGTIGATIATGSFGPLAHAFGRSRDLVLGLEFVTGDGKLARGGGKVVKNVAGFDLVRLMTGSWGTLGIITEVTLRLYSLPSPPVTLALGAPDSVTALGQRITAVFDAPGIPFAVELIDADTAVQLGLPDKQQILVKLGGNAAAVAAQRSAIAALGGAREIDPDVWHRLRQMEDSIRSDSPDNEPPMVLRISTLPQNLPHIWNSARSVVAGIAGSGMHATPSLGIVRCILPSATPMSSVEQLLNWENVTVVFERLPSDTWARLSPTVVDDRLSRRLKAAFDPSGVLNPGILGGEA
jgi:glycolate oxidase FAD binding subunit